MKISKRDGSLVKFYKSKIVQAIIKAMNECEADKDEDLAWNIAEDIELEFEESDVIPTIETVSDRVEELLAENGRFDVSRRYILYRQERDRLRNKIWDMTDLQRDIYEKKYRFEGESFSEFLHRVSGGNKRIEKLIRNKRFMPAGRILAGRGLNERGRKVCYSNCFVNKAPQDNLESIFNTAGEMARTYSYSGGVGITLENLRPRDAKVNNSAESTTGSVSFADLFSLTTGLIGQRGRRGALMLTLPVTHPDIEEFIDIKNDLSKINYANISVMITDEFMSAVVNDKPWEMRFTVKDTGEVLSKVIPAKKLFRKLAKSNWAQAEPGILNWQRVQDYHINSEVDGFEFSATNPCGEVPLMEGSSCLLGSVNLSEYILNPFTSNAEFNYKKLIEDIPYVVEFMDDLLEEGLQYLPLDYQKEGSYSRRELGIGIMGLADMLIKMQLTYGSRQANIFIEQLMSIFSDEIIKASALLAKERGTYPLYDEKVLDSEFIKFVAKDDTIRLIEKYGLRNSQLISIAPTGSISTLWGVSGGAEPVFALSHNRRSESLGDGEDIVYKVYAKIVEEYMDVTGKNSEALLPEYFVTAHDIHYRDRINLQSTLQKYIDNAISSTVNLANKTTVEDIEDLYIYAWQKGLKGITIYRDGCMREGILTADDNKDDTQEDCST